MYPFYTDGWTEDGWFGGVGREREHFFLNSFPHCFQFRGREIKQNRRPLGLQIQHANRYAPRGGVPYNRSYQEDDITKPPPFPQGCQGKVPLYLRKPHPIGAKRLSLHHKSGPCSMRKKWRPPTTLPRLALIARVKFTGHVSGHSRLNNHHHHHLVPSKKVDGGGCPALNLLNSALVWQLTKVIKYSTLLTQRFVNW